MELFAFVETIMNWAAQERALTALIIGLIGAAILSGVINVGAMAVVWLERKVLGDVQSRFGPNRTGSRWGILQLGADAIKLFTKEDIIPKGADKQVYVWAPIVASISTMLVAAAIPFGALRINGVDYPLVVANMDISAFYVEAVLSIMVVAAFMAGFSSYNKYSLLGAFRGMARMISYEVPMGVCVIGVALMAHSLNLVDIVESQVVWYAFAQPIGFVVFTIALITDLGRMPFDQSEAEEELVAGYVTEYGGIRWGLLYFQEYISMVLGSILLVLLFLGGWRGPSIPVITIFSPMIWFLMKVIIVLVFLVWLRASVMRFRIDQVTDLGWKWMLPLSLVNLAWAVLVGLYLA
ncbi:MAG: F(420)H(2) dehydrogenase subunit H [Methanosaeta sp. PtaB.Bin039]|nr:MAG: F(420)H(2) dehydrogenase subunit H [Methanosaeta sp. PtaB.Bin039]OPY45216.1 MAG: F(420)H(2) dehydrogenase subunit H [Methanosaeta sp. PtaU1.Bin028]HQF16616.1 F420H2 dehydrogenase subunit FpoH [Methanotrichaceae archaeon]HQI91248.1 F420H2 dehydrogenase subunit FpoH [Methanotrichaceae archaeon]HQJ61704.1 F420H2 dehydrogenase subunit FpoH [Methanothrix soehngenii]